MATLADALGGLGQNPFVQALSRNSNGLVGFGLGLASGRNSSDGLSRAFQNYLAGNQLDQNAADDRRQREQEGMVQDWVTSSHPDIAQLPPSVALQLAMQREQARLEAANRAPTGPDLTANQSDYLFMQDNPGFAEFLNPAAAGGPTNEDFDRSHALAGEYAALDPVRTYNTVRNSYERIRSSAQLDSGAGDISTIFAYMKMLDPTSVVREGEFATAENAGGVGSQISNLYNRVLSGERLTPELRAEFVRAADQIYSETAANLSGANEQFTGRASTFGVAPDFIINPETYEPINFGGSGAGGNRTGTGVTWSLE